jgi:Cys-tRNA(Pro)/Cys-tRNA(Cys) deacylase
MKTNAIRLLEELGMNYELREYPIDEDDLGAIKVAGQIGLPARQVFKTLVAKGETTGVALAVVPGGMELDLKALARLAGNRKMDLVAINELRQLTGYIRGGVTALACKKPYPVYLDDSAMAWPLISISAGLRGLQILLRPTDYLRATSASLGRIARS